MIYLNFSKIVVLLAVTSSCAFALDGKEVLNCWGLDWKKKVEVVIVESPVAGKYSAQITVDDQVVYTDIGFIVYSSEMDQYFDYPWSQFMIQRVSEEQSSLYLDAGEDALGMPMLPVYHDLLVFCK